MITEEIPEAEEVDRSRAYCWRVPPETTETAKYGNAKGTGYRSETTETAKYGNAKGTGYRVFEPKWP